MADAERRAGDVGGPRLRRRTGLCGFVDLEKEPNGLQQKVVWASDALQRQPVVAEEHSDDVREQQIQQQQNGPYAPTEKVTIQLGGPEERDGTLVRQGDQFEMRVVGCSVVSKDSHFPGHVNKNELVVYSLDCERDPVTKELRESGVPRIHFHYKDQNSVKPDEYQEIPFSRSLVSQSCGGGCGGGGSTAAGAGGGAAGARTSVNVRFKIMELDDVQKPVHDAIDGISNLGSSLSGIDVAAPYLSVLTPALKIAGDVARVALEAYAKPDHVLTVDCGFRIAPRAPVRDARPGEYLRYGYYFFLSEPVQERLYASTSTFNQVILMTRKVGGSPVRRMSNCCLPSSRPAGKRGAGGRRDRRLLGRLGRSVEDAEEYIPLKKVSYLVLKVGTPVDGAATDHAARTRGKLTVSMVQQLRIVVQSAQDQPAEDLKQAIVDIMGQLGGGSTAHVHTTDRPPIDRVSVE